MKKSVFKDKYIGLIEKWNAGGKKGSVSDRERLAGEKMAGRNEAKGKI